MGDTNRTRRERGRAGPGLGTGAAVVLSLATGCAELPPADPARDLAAPEPARIPAPVQTPPPVPKPVPGDPVDTWSVSVEGVPVRELLFALARDAAANVDIDPGIEGRVTMNAVDEPFPPSARPHIPARGSQGRVRGRRPRRPEGRTGASHLSYRLRPPRPGNGDGERGGNRGRGRVRGAGRRGERLRREREGAGRASVLGRARRVGARGARRGAGARRRACSPIARPASSRCGRTPPGTARWRSSSIAFSRAPGARS